MLKATAIRGVLRGDVSLVYRLTTPRGRSGRVMSDICIAPLNICNKIGTNFLFIDDKNWTLIAELV